MKRYAMPLVIVAGMLVMLASLITLAKSTQNSASFESLHVWLVLLAVFLFNLVRLIIQYRQNVVGSRLTARLVTMFSLMAIAPVVVVYYFSYQFISHGIDSWFDVRVEKALSDAMELSRAALDTRVRDLLVRTDRIA